MEKGSLEEDSVVFRPLPPGSVIDFGWAMVIFFIGKPEMREKASKEWDNLSAEIKVVMVETE
ncbi:MAG: hypothetical protein JRC57_09255 [Deltaproteobacteria bacterium]|nr:hypothetical protein [Deltaproteobacteria bacterium]